MREIEMWDSAVREWRLMLSRRPLGPYYQPPEIPLPESLTIYPKRYRNSVDSLAFWTLNSVARGA